VAVLAATTAATALLPGEYKFFLFLFAVSASLIYGLIEVGWQLTKTRAGWVAGSENSYDGSRTTRSLGQRNAPPSFL
jgi:hypothetical protein